MPKEKSRTKRKAPTAAKKRAGTAKSKKAKDELVDSRLMKALTDPRRVKVLSILNERVASPRELADEFGETLSGVAYHFKVLRDFGLIELEKTTPRRGAVEHFYRATHRALVPDDAWKDLPASTKRGIAADIMENIIGDVSASLETGIFGKRDGVHISWTPLILDEEAWDAFSALTEDVLRQVFDLQAEATERLNAEGEEKDAAISVTLALIGFESARAATEGKKAQLRRRY
jgi:DNA-binding transcriptional ArsR family regulator